MKIEKAIETLQTFRDEGDKDLPQDVEPAIQLGIEALKAWSGFRGIGSLMSPMLLPGETED
ncbi:hypothetical protein ES705_26896 [subsurface metagenome]